jgi:hypothetical protein
MKINNWDEKTFREAMIELSTSLSCGGCGRTIKIDSPYTCRTCGRMLCERCHTIYELCEYHFIKEINEDE